MVVTQHHPVPLNSLPRSFLTAKSLSLQGVSSIVLSWLFSPLLTGALAAALFALLRALVLRSPHAYRRAFFVLPVFVFITFFM